MHIVTYWGGAKVKTGSVPVSTCKSASTLKEVHAYYFSNLVSEFIVREKKNMNLITLKDSNII